MDVGKVPKYASKNLKTERIGCLHHCAYTREQTGLCLKACGCVFIPQLGGQFMVRMQRVLWPRGAAEAAPVQAELWQPLHHGPPTALCQPHPTRVHTGLSA